MEHFESLDTNHNETLEMRELAPVITDMLGNLRSSIYAAIKSVGSAMDQASSRDARTLLADSGLAKPLLLLTDSGPAQGILACRI